MGADSHRTSRVVLVTTVVVLFAGVIGWFVNVGVPVREMVCMVPLIAVAYTLLGGILWFVLTHDEPPS